MSVKNCDDPEDATTVLVVDFPIKWTSSVKSIFSILVQNSIAKLSSLLKLNLESWFNFISELYPLKSIPGNLCLLLKDFFLKIIYFYKKFH